MSVSPRYLSDATVPAEDFPTGDTWPFALANKLRCGKTVVRALIAGLRGSAPREAGACMLIDADGIHGTIGGGHLEWQAMQTARAMLNPPSPPAQLRKIILGIELGQCCGGVVELWLERWTPADLPLLDEAITLLDRYPPIRLESQLSKGELNRSIESVGWAKTEVRAHAEHGGVETRGHAALSPPYRPTWVRDRDGITLRERLDNDAAPLWLFGAGHVGQALLPILRTLPFRLHWIDPRPGQFPAAVPRVHIHNSADALAAVRAAPAGTRYVVMTHDHALDYALVRAILERGDFAYAGLIGSDSKAARFRSRLRRDGIDDTDIERLACPIGVPGIASKLPAAIAVSVAAQLLQSLGERQTSTQPATGCEARDCTSCHRNES